MASSLETFGSFGDSDDTDEALHRPKVIRSAYDSETFDLGGHIFVDGHVGSATISPSGRDVALASPDGLTIIDLDSIYSPPRRVKSHGMPWLVVDVQWSPFAARDYWVASTANHCCLVWNLNRPDDSSAGAVEHSLRGHHRSITDINFSAHHPDMLATCSVDGAVHCWDLRRSVTPALTFVDWTAGATQVKYNRQDEHVLASSHNRSVHIWDDRKAALPLRTIEAHSSKIYGLDWNRTRSTCLVTCSLDRTIKFWDYSLYGYGGSSLFGAQSSTFTANTNAMAMEGSSISTVAPINDVDVPERVIRTTFPVWRARHTPFGNGLLAMPQSAPGYLYMYDARPSSVLSAEDAALHNEPVKILPGHGEHRATEFLWRTRGDIMDGADNREFELVTWGEDNCLRLCPTDSAVLASVGFRRGQPAPPNLHITRKGAVYKSFRSLDDIGDYEKRNATMSSLQPFNYRGSISLPTSQHQSQRDSPTPEEHHLHSSHHSHDHGEHSAAKQHKRQRSSHEHAKLPPQPSKPLYPLPRSLSSSNVMRDVVKSPAPARHARFDQRSPWQSQSMRVARGAGRTTPNLGNAQVSWMKNVTINKRKATSELDSLAAQDPLSASLLREAGRKVSTDSAQSSPMHASTHDASISVNSDNTNEPESIHEEIIRINRKLPNVTWENIDLDNLTLTASMTGPWGANGQPTYIKVRIVVPSNYPTVRAPRFFIENNVLVPEANQDRMAADLLALSSECLKRHRNCLLIAFRYLLGDVDRAGGLASLNRALTIPRLSQLSSTGDDSNISSSSSSSSDDEDDAANMDAYVGPAVDGPLGPLPPTPPPRSCGAYFTRDGRLVSFYLTKTGKASAMMMSEESQEATNSKPADGRQPVFIGFGKVLPSHAGPSRRRRASSSGDESDSSAHSDASSASSCLSSSSTSSSSSLSHRYAPNMMDPWTANMGFQRYILQGKDGRRKGHYDADGDMSDSLVQSGTLDPSMHTGPKSTVAIEDMRPFLPARQELALGYIVFGDGAEVCQHNARVAKKLGEKDLASIWRYAALLLRSDIPLTAHFAGGQRQKPILVIAREAVAQAKKDARKRGHQQKAQSRHHLSGRVKWGLHPLAREYVDDLFDYFEKRADVQMLAMLSCVFGESFEEDSVAYAESHLSKSDTPLPMKAPSFSLAYVPSTRGLVTSTPPHTLSPSAYASRMGSASNSTSMLATPAALFFDGSIDPDEDGDEEHADDFDDEDYKAAMWAAGPDAGAPYGKNSLSGSTLSRGGSGAGVLSSSPLFGAMAGRFFRRGNNAVMSAIAAGIPQTLTSLISSSPNDRSGGGGGGGVGSGSSAVAVAVPQPPHLHRRTSSYSQGTRTPRDIPQKRGSPLTSGQPLTHAYRQHMFQSGAASTRVGTGVESTSPKTKLPGKPSLVSPPSTQSHTPVRKRPSPADTIFGNLTAGKLTWAASALFGGGGGGGGSNGGRNTNTGRSTESGTASTSAIGSPSRRREEANVAAAALAAAKGAQAEAEAASAAASVVAVQIKVRTFNDHLFDEDGWMVTSLLDGQRRPRLYAGYRYAYSELLQVWAKPLARLEVLKFNGLREDAMRAAAARDRDEDGAEPGKRRNGSLLTDTSSSSKTALALVPLTTSQKTQRLEALRDSGRGLDAVGICERCELQLEPVEYNYDVRGRAGAGVAGRNSTTTTTTTTTTGGALGMCHRCRHARTQLRCVFCTEPVDALYLPCFGCGCASHPQCLREWHDAGERYCPAGDDCACYEEALNGRIESWTAMRAQVDPVRRAGSVGSNEVGDAALKAARNAYHQHATSRALLSQSQRSAHYALASTSLASPTNDSSRGGTGKGGDTAFLDKGRRSRVSLSSVSSRQDDRESATDAASDAGTDANSEDGSGVVGGGDAVVTTGFWGRSSRRSKPAASGLRQYLQQQQLEQRQQESPDGLLRRSSTDLERHQTSYGQGGPGGPGASGQHAQPPRLRSEQTMPASSHLSAARLSLSNRLLRNATLRRQESNGGDGANNGGSMPPS